MKSWGSHIGRHIYTNYLITNGLLKNIVGHNDPKLLMNLRGDSNTKSAEVYLNLENTEMLKKDELLMNLRGDSNTKSAEVYSEE